MDNFDIRRFDQYREDNRLEVKKASGGLPNSLWETYSSMANCYGGVIILGVIENNDGSFNTTGLKDDAKLKKIFWDTINNRTKVNINLLTDSDVETYNMNGEIIMVIHVPRAKRDQRPVYINNDIWNGTYRRNWEGDYHCTPSEIKAMLRDQPEEAMDMIVLEDFSLSDLNDDTIQSYRNYHSTVKPGHVWGKLQKEDYLEKIGAAGRIKAGDELHPTAAGLLMFGEEYRIVRRFPDYFLDYREELGSTIRWTNRIQSSSGDWSGNLFDFFFRVYNKLTIDIEKPFALDGVTRVEDTPVHKAVREALVNCIVNTDFYLPEGIVILKKKNKIVFQNPGSIRTGKTQMLRGGISDPRNKSIMKMLNLISIGERAGSGFPDIYSVWANKGWEEPVVEEQYAPDRTILILSFVSNENFVTYISDADYVNNKADCGSDSGVGDADYRTDDADYGADRGVGDADYRTDDADYGADRGVGDADYRTDDADYGANRGVCDADYGTDDADYGADRGVGDADYEAYEADNNTNHESNDANHSLDKGTIEVIILSSLRENPRITQKEIAAKIGVSRATIQRIMKSMIDEGIVVRIGTKSGYWQIRE